jgi:hypothetical protein
VSLVITDFGRCVHVRGVASLHSLGRVARELRWIETPWPARMDPGRDLPSSV